jgi:hypothetical protein
MSKQVESSVNMVRQDFRVGFLGIGITERCIEVVIPPGGVACQNAQNLEVRSFDSRAKNRHAARDDVDRYTRDTLQAMLPLPVWNACSCHLHRELCNTHSRHWDFVSR